MPDAMNELRDLTEVIEAAKKKIAAYRGRETRLPAYIKEELPTVKGYNITYYEHTAVANGVYKGEKMRVFLSNQWFVIAAYLMELYDTLQAYQSYALKAFTKEELRKLKGKSLTDAQLDKIKSLDLTQEAKERLAVFVTNYKSWGGGKDINRGDFFASAILSAAGVMNDSHSFIADICVALAAEPHPLINKLINFAEAQKRAEDVQASLAVSALPLQQITYGAPGTGKSHMINEETRGQEVVRTTFHPETDYASFVGCYKPVAEGGNITYGFVPQAFARAYVKAWQLYGNGQRKSDEAIATEYAAMEPAYLVIEEINRGNCAQIFGDLFQLLDRSEAGFSKYPVYADADLAKYLAQEFAELELPNATEIDTLLDEEGAAEKIKQGTLLALPPNLYLRATMNTSDQSLFPIDSAFKRRWDWRRVGICDKGQHWQICVDENRYDWWHFLKAINGKIATITASEDKQLGYFFCTLPDGEREISAEMLVSKVFFYLWTDVFKDYELDDPIFRYTDAEDEEQTLTFDKFFDDAAEGELIESRVTDFLERLGLMPETDVESENGDETRPAEDGDGSAPGTASANGENAVGYTADEAENAYAIVAENPAPRTTNSPVTPPQRHRALS